MSDLQTESKESESLSPRRRWKRWTLLAMLIVAMSHSWWLGAFGEFLVSEAPLSQADVALVLGGDHRLQKAADLLASGAVSEIWLIEREPTYAIEAGILPSDHEVALEELETHGVPVREIHVLSGQANEYDQAAKIVAQELNGRPQTRMIVLCHRLHGRNVRIIFGSVMENAQADEIQVLPLPADEFNEHHWWRSRTGWKEFFTAASDLMVTLMVGIEPNDSHPPFDPDDYERKIISRYGETACHDK